ncbi:MAG TPA: ABC transporter substrate-binding protein, partial [Anaerolineales bacterium]|nr:ABC transporter substrate-binding protein [Anaerolineales bacterium]
MNAKRMHGPCRMGLIGSLALAIILAACAPAPTAAPSPMATTVPTAVPVVKPTATPEPTPVPKPQIVVAYDSDIDHVELMQFRSLGAYDATANLYEPLIRQKLVENPNGELIGQREFEGAVAESFEVSEDGTVFTFHLRQDARFADGTPITAQDYKYTFDRAMQGPGYIGLLTPFMALDSPDDVEVVDDYTLRITTSRPAALTETIIAFQVFGAISKATGDAHATTDDPWADEWHHTNANSSGPYVITEWNPGTEYVFEPNPNYWRGPEWFQNSGMVFRVVPDAATREQLLRAGDVDVALGIPYSDLNELDADPDITIHAIPTTRVYHLGMNINVPPFDDKRVRQAVSMAIPYEAIVENVIYGYGRQPTSPIPEGMEGHTDEFWTYGEADLDEARALLAETDYPDGFEVELTVPQEDQTRVDAATWVQSGLAEIGIEVTINAVPTAEFSGLINSHELPFFIQEWYSWGNDPFYQLTWNFKCGSFPNFVNYCNEELDQIIEDGTFSRDPTERAELARRAQEILVDEAVWAFLYQPDWIVA